MSDASSLSKDRISGIKNIAAFTGWSERRTYYLAERGEIPGVFRVGSRYEGFKSEIEAGLRAKARGEQRNAG